MDRLLRWGRIVSIGWLKRSAVGRQPVSVKVQQGTMVPWLSARGLSAMMVSRGHERVTATIAHDKMLRVIQVVWRDGMPCGDPGGCYEGLWVGRLRPR